MTMKVVNSFIIRAVCSILVGILLVANPEKVAGVIVQIIGGLFLISGTVSIINYIVIKYSKKQVVKPVFPIIALGSALFGTFVLFFPQEIISYFMYFLGALMVLAGFNQMWGMVRMRKIVPMRWYYPVFYLVVMAMGIFVIFKPMESASLPFILLGVNILLYGILEFIGGVRWRKYSKLKVEAEKKLLEATEKESSSSNAVSSTDDASQENASGEEEKEEKNDD